MRHLSDEQLAAVARAEGGPAQHRHLRRCPACAARFDDLRTVRRALGALPPPPLPDGVLDDLRHQVPSRAPQPSRGHRSARGRRLPLRLEPQHLAAVALLALLAGGVSIALRGSHGSGTAPVDTALSRTSSPAAATPSPTASLAAHAAVLAVPSAPLVVDLGRDYHRATLAAGGVDLLAAVSHPRTTGPLARGATTAAALAATVPTAPCLRALAERIDTGASARLDLVAVEAARYDARPATVLLLMDPDRRLRGTAVAVADRCAGPEPVVLAQAAVVG